MFGSLTKFFERFIEQHSDRIAITIAVSVLIAVAACGYNTLTDYSDPEFGTTAIQESIVQAEVEFVGQYGIIENGIYYQYARKPAEPVWEGTFRITHYGEPDFPIDNYTARWINGEGVTVRDGIEWADSLGLDGICAVDAATRWYNEVRDEFPPIIEIEDHGRYLAIDRVGWGTDIDIYIQDSSAPLFAHYRRAREIGRTNNYE